VNFIIKQPAKTTKTIHLVVSVVIDDDADAHDTIADCEFSLTGKGINSAEIITVTDENDQDVF
jgi:hypothetical protein